MLNDREILRLFEKHDERALMETTARYETYCRTIAHTLLGEESAAKECFREALRDIWKNIPPKNTESLKTYMGKLVRAEALKYREEEAPVANEEEIAAILEELEECVEEGFSGAENRDADDGLVEVIDDFLASVPASKRSLFVQRYWYGQTIWSIGAKRHMSPDLVDAGISEVRAGLAQAFQEAKTVWPLDGKTFLMERIGGIDPKYILEAEGAKTGSEGAQKAAASGERMDDDEENDERRKPVDAKKILKIACIVGGVLAVVALIVAIRWTSNTPIPIDEKHFPDEYFREYVAEGFDLDKDGELSVEERQDVFKIELVSTRSNPYYANNIGDIQSLKGIGYFPNLEYLKCTGTQVTSLDLSANKALETLICSDGKLESLDVSANKALEYLDCSGNQLTKLDVRSNKLLEELDCRNNQIEEIKFRSNETLKTLSCQDNLLGHLDASPNKALKTLNCSKNQMTELDLSENSKLEVFSCTGSSLMELDLSGNPAMKWVECSGNQIHQLNVHENPLLEVLGCDDNELLELDLSQNTKLTSLSCENNSLTSLDLRSCADLAHLYMEGNQIRVLELNDPMINHLITLFD
ncbi:MAG: hypothetical protein IKS10_09550 [Lachnospiraceae bacterium]|nr:hypothetical protein [Lachnospiraceae bacterium]